jgi:nitrogen regulatory protein P-II 1
MIVHTSIQRDLADLLRSLHQIQGFTFSHAEGHGTQEANDPFLSERDKVVGYVPRVRVDILLEDTQVERVLESVRTMSNIGGGMGVFWVNDVHYSGRL